MKKDQDKKTKRPTFDDWSEAFDYCREADHPVIVRMAGEGTFKLYPSGRADRYNHQSR